MDEKTVKQYVEGTIIPVAKQELSWLQKHERLVISILVIIALFLGYNKYIDHAAKVSDENAAISATVLKQQQDINKQLIDRMNVQDQRFADLMQEMNRRNQMLESAIQSRNKGLEKQQAINNTLPLFELAGRWKSIIKVLDDSIKVDGQTVTVSDLAARQTVNQLESVEVLRSNLNDKQTQLDNTKSQVTECKQALVQKDEVIKGKDKEIADAKDDTNKQVKKVKDDARRSKRNWFFRGMATGGGIAIALAIRFGVL